MESTVIRGATVVTQDRERRVLTGDVLVDGHKIVSVGEKGKADKVIDAKGKLLIPGLINLHTHLAMGLLRGYGDDMTLEPWLKERIWPAEAKIDATAMRAGAALGAVEMVRGGTTSFLDMYFMQEEAAWPAVKEVGLRSWLGEGMVDVGQTPEGEPNKKLKAIESFVKKTVNDPLVTACPAPHATYTCHKESYVEAARIARENQVPLHTHCSETRTEVYDVEKAKGARPVKFLHDAGALLPQTVLAHCGWVTKAEVEAIGKAGAHVAHCPVSNLKLATGGTCPVPEFQQANVRVGIGTDGASSNNTLSMFESMKFAALVQKQHRWDPTILPAQRVLDMATRDGADALGRPDLGRIEPGATADLVLVDLARPHLTPLHDPVSQLVYAASAQDVAMTMVHGRVLFDGTMRTIDETKVLKDAAKAAANITA